MVRRKLNNEGFTFVELVIAVAILSIITVSIATFMATTSRVYSKTTHNNEVQSQAVEVYDQISNCIMQANKIVLCGYTWNESAGSFDTTLKYFVSDNLPYAQGTSSSVAGYDSNGNLVDSDHNLITTFYKASSEASDSPTTQSGKMYAFKSLKEEDVSDPNKQNIKEIKVKALYLEYQTKTGKATNDPTIYPNYPYENCYATFYVSDDGDLYLKRHYDSDAGISNYRIDSSVTNPPIAVLDMYPTTSSLLCKTLEDDGFRVMVDADNNSIGLVLNFDNYTMTYDTLGMVKIRNKAVLTR